MCADIVLYDYILKDNNQLFNSINLISVSNRRLDYSSLQRYTVAITILHRNNE